MNTETTRLLRYLDGEMPPAEAEQFRVHLAENPELQRRLADMQRVGALVRHWAAVAETKGGRLLEETLSRVHEAERQRARRTTLGYVLAAALVLVLPWSRHAPELLSSRPAAPARSPASSSGAAIERVQATDQQAQVFVLGNSGTPVVWLADDAADEDDAEQQDPG